MNEEERKRERRRDIISVLFLVLLVIAIVALLLSIIALVKNKDMLRTDPAKYLVKQYPLIDCTCTGEDGKPWMTSEDGLYTMGGG